jgi:hypothetical protein
MSALVSRYTLAYRMRWIPPILPLATLGAVCYAAKLPLDALRARVNGVYTLAEWHADGQVFRPPTVEGRMVLLNGTIVVVHHNRTKWPTETTLVAFGRYTLDADSFGYKYESTSVVTETPSASTVSHKPLWDGIRSFSISYEHGLVRLRSESGKQAFVFGRADVTYYEGGQVLLVWRRTSG